jgi:spore coat protein U-like protein
MSRLRATAQRHNTANGTRRLFAIALLSIIAPNSWSACSVSAQGVDFGSYDPFGRNNLDGAGNIALTCDPGVTYTITLSNGSGPYAGRVMTNGPYSLHYNLYTDASRLFVWGDGNGGTATVSGSGAAAPVNVTIYGRIPAGQNARVGNYSDNVVVTVTF